ncbi:MAG: PAS domain-containing sensor histidine kinase [Flavobacteriales bacterium]
MPSRFDTDQLSRIGSLLFASAAEGLVVVDGTGMICLKNPRLDHLFGYAAEELLGQRIETLIPMNRRENHERQRQGYHADPVQRSMGSGLDLMGQRKDGSHFPVEVSLNHFEMDGERFVMGLVSDVTKRRQAERDLLATNASLEERVQKRTLELLTTQEELHQALEAEKELNALKSRFVSMASHEFRTPLSTIMSSVDLIGRYTENSPEERTHKHVERIRAKVRELTGMLNDFLSLDKLEQGSVSCNPAELDVVHMSIELIEELRSLAKPGQEIEYDHIGNERIVFQDRAMLHNVLSNLLGNAIKYSPENKRIDLTTVIDAGTLTIQVKDSGIGIPLEDQQHLFERFFRAGNAFTVQGTGLGLNIVRKYLDLMGGLITFVSTPGEGTTFTVTIAQRNSA